eukprot:Platyproteum_vivax@DN5372_c3_g1_i1.p1
MGDGDTPVLEVLGSPLTPHFDRSLYEALSTIRKHSSSSTSTSTSYDKKQTSDYQMLASDRLPPQSLCQKLEKHPWLLQESNELRQPAWPHPVNGVQGDGRDRETANLQPPIAQMDVEMGGKHTKQYYELHIG